MKIIFALLFSIITLSAYSQQQAGDLSIQFSGNFTSQRVKTNLLTTKIYSGNIYVKIGKFFTQNIEMGLKPSVFFSPKIEESPKDPNNPKTTVKTNIGLGLYGTYSFLTADAKFMPYGGAEVNYLPFGDEAMLNLGPYAGVKYFVTEKINLANTYDSAINTKVSPTFQFNIGIGVIISKANP